MRIPLGFRLFWDDGSLAKGGRWLEDDEDCSGTAAPDCIVSYLTIQVCADWQMSERRECKATRPTPFRPSARHLANGRTDLTIGPQHRTEEEAQFTPLPSQYVPRKFRSRICLGWQSCSWPAMGLLCPTDPKQSRCMISHPGAHNARKAQRYCNS